MLAVGDGSGKEKMSVVSSGYNNSVNNKLVGK
jgi:hypothetical protein